ncbi:hypothetical protein C2869_02635 [Saccharobesus litoralis]|uniref:Uncharacterized protein n=1 Tax=Saccharobesus litoralis TaxID=2172099 RepID=A0A2S0VMF3_9ALTE|nr:hypothetical protein [Saccharobesus litoralis]AWB65401.1 hypothetical protein C2869_02635 [Saccharobesus litoralis]
MKFYFKLLAIIFAFSIFNVFASEQSELYKLLESKITADYKEQRRFIELGFRDVRELKYEYQTFKAIHSISDFSADLSKLSSPTSDALGKSYVSVVKQLAEEMGSELDAKPKGLFTSLLDVLIPPQNNSPDSASTPPMLDGLDSLLGASPYASLINGVGTMALQFLDVRGGGGLSAPDKHRIGTKKVEKFFNETKPYLVFYETLAQGNKHFKMELESIIPRSKQFEQRISLLRNSIKQEFDIDVTKENWDELFDKKFIAVNENSSNSIKEVLKESNKKSFKTALQYAESAKTLRNDIANEQDLLISNLIANIDVIITGLNSAKKQAIECSTNTGNTCKFKESTIKNQITKFQTHRANIQNINLKGLTENINQGESFGRRNLRW